MAAVAAAMLMASVLAAVAGAPAQAANTATEVLLDTDHDGVGDTRQFGGEDRYDTALRLARQFADLRGGPGSVTNVFVASGHSLVDAVSVAGLAGSLDAPVLLSPTDRLHRGVANFIQDLGVPDVWILGGPDAVSAEVAEALAALEHKPDVARIAGADRYETAAMIAGRLSVDAYWCGAAGNSAVLVNGATDSLMEAVAVSPIANRLQLPMLMTEAGELPEATASFIRRNDVEFVAIIGNEAAVSKTVESALAAAGVVTVKRFAGSSAAATSAVLADLAVNGDCASYVDPAPHTVALVDRDGLPDGITAAPVLNRSLSSVSGLVPVLIVGDSLPSAVRSYLAATPAEQNGRKVQLNILAIGGTNAVSQSVMDAALSAAASAPSLTVDIVSAVDHDGDGSYDDQVRAGETLIRLNFSDDIDGTSLPTLQAKLLDIIRLDRARLVVPPSNAITYGGGGIRSTCEPDVATLAVVSPLRGGQTISVANSTLQFGANSDLRGLVGTTHRVKSTNSPSVSIPVAIIGDAGKTFTFRVTDDDGFLPTETVASTEITPRPHNFDPAGNSSTNSDQLLVASGPTANALSGSPATVTERSFTVTMNRVLKSGDSITVNAGAITDIGGMKSGATTGSVYAATKNPSLSSVTVSSHVANSQAKFRVPIAITGGDGAPVADNSSATHADMFFTAKRGSAAEGVDGNDWTFHFHTTSTYNPATAKGKALEIEVFVEQSTKRVHITFVAGEGKFSDLRRELEADRSFNALWAVSADPETNTDHCKTADNPLTVVAAAATAADRLETGTELMAVEASFAGTYPVKKAYSAPLLADILVGTFERAGVANAAAWLARDEVTLWLDNTSTTALTDTNVTTAATSLAAAVKSGPLKKVRYEIQVTDTKYLPKSGDLVMVEAGTSNTNSIAEGYDASNQWNAAKAAFSISTGAAVPTG